MKQYVQPFIERPIASEREEEDMLYYYDAKGLLLASLFHEEGQFCSACFYGEGTLEQITEQQVIDIAEAVKRVFAQDELQLHKVDLEEDGYLVEFRRIEPVYNLLVQGVGLFVTVTKTGFVASIALNELDIEINYPEVMISKEEARTILQQQPILQLGIAREMDWRYTYKPNYDLFGVDPDGKVRLWSDDEAMQDACFKPLPQVEPIDDLIVFIKGGRDGELEHFESADEKCWAFETEDEMRTDVDAFTRACQVVQHLVGEYYELYHFEKYEMLRKLLHMDEHTFETYRFVPIYDGIPFDFEAIAISVDTETNQIASVRYSIIPFNQFAALPKPTITLEEANVIAAELIDVELFLESSYIDSKQRSFVYMIDYPTSPTGAHIQFVDAFTGKIHWIDNR